jgi:hypothetical protein
MLALREAEHVRRLHDIAAAHANLEEATTATRKDREREWHEAQRAYQVNERLRWWLVLSKRDTANYRVIRAGDVEDEDIDSRSWRDFQKKWYIVQLLRGYWLLERKDTNPTEGMSQGMIDKLKEEDAQIAAERMAKGVQTEAEKQQSEASARSKKYRLMKKAKELFEAFWEEATAEKDAILRETTMGYSDETKDKAWTAALEAVRKKYGLKNDLMNPEEHGNLAYYDELFKSGELLQKPPKKEPTAPKKKGKAKV